MSETKVTTRFVDDQAITRSKVNTSLAGQAVIAKILPVALSGVKIDSYSGVDSGTGDVGLALDYTHLDTLYSQVGHGHAIADITGLQTALNNKLETSLKGSANGLAELDANGFVKNTQLPSYVDDVLEYSNFASLPVTGESGKIYITIDDNKTYRWSGSIYAEISASLALGETSSTAYRGDRGKIAYDYSQIGHWYAGTGNHPTTIAGYGITDIPTTLPASDVYAWAKASVKPSYDFSEIGSKPTTISGYGITDSLVYTNDNRLSDARVASDVYSWAKAPTKPSYSYSEVGAAPASTVSFPGFGITHALAAYGDHDHAGVYQPVGSYLTSETDPVFTAWNKSTGISITKSQMSDFPTLLSQFGNDLGNYGGFLTGITSLQVTTALGYTPYNATNPANYITAAALTGYATQSWVSGQGYVTGTPWTAVGYWYAGAGNHPTTTTGYGLPDYPTTLPASDVYSWAKASTKPSYTLSELGAQATLTNPVTANTSSFSANYITKTTGTNTQIQETGISVDASNNVSGVNNIISSGRIIPAVDLSGCYLGDDVHRWAGVYAGYAIFSGSLTALSATFTTGAGAGKIFTSDSGGNGSWQTVNSAIGGDGLTANYLSKWDGSKFADSYIDDNGYKLRINTGGNRFVDLENATNTLMRLTHNGVLSRIQSYTGGAYGILALNPDGGTVQVGNLVGTGTRSLFADTNGTLTTTAPISGAIGYWTKGTGILYPTISGDTVTIYDAGLDQTKEYAGLINSLSLRNTSISASALNRMRIGNNSSANAFTIDVFSSNYTSYENYVRIINQHNAPLQLGGYGDTALTLGSGGAATFLSTIQATTGKFTNLSNGYMPLQSSGALVNSPAYSDGTNVSIGGTNLLYKLAVVGGDIIVDNARPLRGYTTTGGAYRLISIESDNNIYIAQSGGNVIMNGNGSNLFLGYSSDPTSSIKLAVNGNGYFGGRLFVDGNLSGNNISFIKNVSSTGYGLLVQGGNASNYAIYAQDYAGNKAFEVLGNGNATFAGSLTGLRLISNIANGTAPLTVTSTTLVDNLNADLLDGQHGAYYQPASTAITTSNIASQSVNYAASAGAVAWTGVISRPTLLSQFSNDLGNYGGFLTAITSTQVTTALGYTPYNATNPAGYITSDLRWDGGSTGLVAATGRTSLGLGSAALSASTDFRSSSWMPSVEDLSNVSIGARTAGDVLKWTGSYWTNSPDAGMVYPGAGIAVSTGSAWGTSITNNSANWNAAAGWGNHAQAGYLTGITSGQVTTALGFTPYNATNPAGYITTAALSGYEPSITAGTITQYWRGDKTWQTLPGSYTLPNATTSVLGGIKVGTYLTMSGTGSDVLKLNTSWTGSTSTSPILYSDSTTIYQDGTFYYDDSYNRLYVDRVVISSELAVYGSGTFDGGVAAAQFSVSGMDTPPASMNAAGMTGDIRFCADGIYVCVATNSWLLAAFTIF